MKWNLRRMKDINRWSALRLIVLSAIILSWASVVEAADPIPQSERDALLALYSNTNG
jgi:hypothetical protein